MLRLQFPQCSTNLLTYLYLNQLDTSKDVIIIAVSSAHLTLCSAPCRCLPCSHGAYTDAHCTTCIDYLIFGKNLKAIAEQKQTEGPPTCVWKTSNPLSGKNRLKKRKKEFKALRSRRESRSWPMLLRYDWPVCVRGPELSKGSIAQRQECDEDGAEKLKFKSHRPVYLIKRSSVLRPKLWRHCHVLF